MGYIFVSYSHEDAVFVSKLVKSLESEGFNAWIDNRIDYGAKWPHVIQEKLDACDAFILVMSPDSYESQWVQNELARAHRKKKPIFPLLLEGREPWLSVEAIQYYDMRNEKLPDEKFFEHLSSVTDRQKEELAKIEKYLNLKDGLQALNLHSKPVIAHASLKSFGFIRGGSEKVVADLISSVGAIVMPSFTYKTMLIPHVGPPNNGISYGKHSYLNTFAEPYFSDMPVDPLIGTTPETLRHHPKAWRTSHPILSFVGVNAISALETQTIDNPFAPIGWLADRDGWVLLLGVDHTVNTSIHFGEKMAGRKQFVRWALIGNRAVECSEFPGCSDGFEAIRPAIRHVTRRVEIGNSFIEAIPLHPLLQAVKTILTKNPLALLCQREECERCNAIRNEFIEV